MTQDGFSTRKLGNVFVLGEAVAVGVRAGGGAWQLRDPYGRVVLRGQLEPGAETLVLELPRSEQGHYLLSLTADGRRYETSLALLTPFEVSAVADSPFGICTHYGQLRGADTDPGAASKENPESIPLLALAGFKTQRDELTWSRSEPIRGTRAFPNAHRHYLGRCGEHAVASLIILNYNNRHYDGGLTPHTADGLMGFAAYARQIVRRYGSQLRAVEVWNEYNGAFSRGPAARRPEGYLELLKHTYRAVKQERPDLRVIGPAAVTLPYSWLEALFKLGALEYLDAVSVHPYIYPRQPDTRRDSLDALLLRLQALIKKYNGGRPKPLELTELGWPTQRGGTTVLNQARYAVRSVVLALSVGVEKIYWYTLLSTGPDPRKREHNFGLLHHPDDPKGAYTPKPAYVSLAVAARQLTSATFVRRDDTPDGVFSFVFEHGSEPLRVLWLADRDGQAAGMREISLQTDGALEVTEMFGRVYRAEPRGGRVSLTISASPVYVRGEADLSAPGLLGGLRRLFG